MNSTSVNESDRLRFVLAGLRSAGVSMMYQDTDLVIRFSANLPETWSLGGDLDGRTDETVFSPPHVEKVLSAKRGVIANAQPTKIEILRDVDHERHWYMLNIEPDMDPQDNVIGVFTTITDIDDLKYRETVLKTLLRELSHRSRISSLLSSPWPHRPRATRRDWKTFFSPFETASSQWPSRRIW